MGQRYDFSDIGRMVGDSIRNAVQSQDYQQLKNAAKNLGSQLKNIRFPFENTGAPYQGQNQDPNGNQNQGAPQGAPQGQPQYAQPGWNAPRRQPAQAPVRPRRYRMVSSINGWGLVMMILGVPVLAFALTSLLLLFTGSMPLAGLGQWFVGVICGVLAAGSGTMLFLGSRLNRRNQRYRRYQMQLRDKQYCEIKELAAATGYRENTVVNDMEDMLQRGLFDVGYLDDGKSCVILDREVYQQYQNAQRRAKQEETQEHLREQQRKQAGEDAPELAKALEEGAACIAQIRGANQKIQGEDLSRKIDRLEMVTQKIFDYVEEHPDQLPDIRRFMEYYLPTTLKLLDAYGDFERQPIQGKNIQEVKNEIENTLDTINQAFENLLNQMFQDDALDISTDISALQAILRQDGLTDQKDGPGVL